MTFESLISSNKQSAVLLSLHGYDRNVGSRTTDKTEEGHGKPCALSVDVRRSQHRAILLLTLWASLHVFRNTRSTVGLGPSEDRSFSKYALTVLSDRLQAFNCIHVVGMVARAPLCVPTMCICVRVWTMYVDPMSCTLTCDLNYHNTV